VFHPLLLCAACAPVSRLPPLPGDEIKAEQHELAHANLGHLNNFSRVLNQAVARAFSIAFEREADYVGGYYTARAGYGLTPERRFIRSDVEGTKVAPAP
jgi:hypothetical protein